MAEGTTTTYRTTALLVGGWLVLVVAGGVVLTVVGVMTQDKSQEKTLSKDGDKVEVVSTKKANK